MAIFRLATNLFHHFSIIGSLIQNIHFLYILCLKVVAQKRCQALNPYIRLKSIDTIVKHNFPIYEQRGTIIKRSLSSSNPPFPVLCTVRRVSFPHLCQAFRSCTITRRKVILNPFSSDSSGQTHLRRLIVLFLYVAHFVSPFLRKCLKNGDGQCPLPYPFFVP